MNRILSIDVFRGVTMFLMLWVNDFWTLSSVPKWLTHAVSGEDYLGFSDLIFPWFLFAIGLSIPFAFESRLLKESKESTIWMHIFLRFIALLTMGLFHMNMEMYGHQTSILNKPVFVIISTFAFFMIWNDNSKIDLTKNTLFKVMPYLGSMILGTMVLIYNGQDYDGNSIGFSIHWWGILGLIGWVYLIAASTYFVFRRSMVAAIVAFFASLLLNVVSSSGIPYNIFPWQSTNWLPGSGGLQALTFGGIITSLCLVKYKNEIRKLYSVLMIMGVTSLGLGLLLRKYFIISKIGGTPTWVLISMSTALFLFVIFHWLVDVRGDVNWYYPIKTAGTATLTCYLVPYVYYSLRTMIDIQLPTFLTTGLVGLMKSIVYALIIITISWGLTRAKIRLKI
ncbi:MAG: DUF5009 domain-containing protein [Candidatus Marinimicrobia bacterium]|jgi:predicted acyltransferase|nr:DUF5009 domain-containing protein [Candidatus Neomarinimicrobiota bacterium]|tara:strand:+ start:1463 stop:2644 length:1182 start_codon:yes stop_codon:yes gene_type:complete